MKKVISPEDRFLCARATFEQALKLAEQEEFYLLHHAMTQMNIADWQRIEERRAKVKLEIHKIEVDPDNVFTKTADLTRLAVLDYLRFALGDKYKEIK